MLGMKVSLKKLPGWWAKSLNGNCGGKENPEEGTKGAPMRPSKWLWGRYGNVVFVPRGMPRS